METKDPEMKLFDVEELADQNRLLLNTEKLLFMVGLRNEFR
jgi:hypothetical protein